MRSIAKTNLLHLITAMAVCAGVVALGTKPAAASCPPGTVMHQADMVITTNARVHGTPVQTTCLVSGKSEMLTAQQTITRPHGTYSFLFWDVNGQIKKTLLASFKAPKVASFNANAWYMFYPKCAAPPCGGGYSNITTFGFQADKNRPIAGTPIGSVSPNPTPSPPWTPPSSVAYTNKMAITINAANPLDFIYWFPIQTSGIVVKSTELAAGMGVTSLAIAFYGPNPCTYISPPAPGELGPGASVAAYQAAAKYDMEQYNACVARHGGATPIPK